MRGHTRQRSNGKWEFQIPMGKNPDGSRKRITGGGFASQEEAEQALIKKLYEINAGLFVEPSKETVYNFFVTWLAQKQGQLKPSTYAKYRGHVNNHVIPFLRSLALSKLTTQHIQHMYLSLQKKNSPRTIKHLHLMLSQALKRAVKLKIISENPAENCLLPKVVTPEAGHWSVEELRQFLSIAKSSRWYTAFLLAAYTGARQGEILALQWKNIDLFKGTVTIKNSVSKAETGFKVSTPKTRSSLRQVNLPPSVVAELRQLKAIRQISRRRVKTDARVFDQPSDFVVHTFNGKYLNPRNFSKEWYRLIKLSGLNQIRFHDLRHTHATLLLQAGINMKAVSRRLGHSTVGITLDTYSHVTPQMEEGITAALEQMIH